MKDEQSAARLREALVERFGESFSVDASLPGLDALARIAAHRTQRRYTDNAVDPTLLRLLCACALSAPSKSDLQQCDILVVADAASRRAIGDLIPDMPWVATAPVFLVFLANGRRLKRIARERDFTLVPGHDPVVWPKLTAEFRDRFPAGPGA